MLLIKNATLLTMSKLGNIQKGYLAIKQGKIVAIGNQEQLKNYTEQATKTIDASGKYVCPGFVDAHTHLGIANSSMRWEGSDYNEIADPVTPQMRAMDGINAYDESFGDALSGGVTTVGVSPGSANIFGGMICAIKTGGSKCVDNLIVEKSLAIKCALGENPKNVFGQMQKKSPFTRMASASLLRETFSKTQEYLEKKQNATKDKPHSLDAKYQALIPVIKREVAMHIHCHRADDIHTAIRISKEFDLKTVLIHASEGHLAVDEIKASGYPAIVGPTMTFKTKPELANKSFLTIKNLLDAGVLACITTDHPVIPLAQFNICAALAAKSGLDEDSALKAITLNAAQVMGLDDRIGSIEIGKDGDVAIWDRHPFDARASVLTTFINGEIVYTT